MIPFKDDNPTQLFPFVTISLITLNILVYVMQVTYPANPGRVAYAYGAIPHFLLTFQSVQPIHPAMTVFSSMFMHGSILHLGTNMLYLWIFGNNIEDRLGYGRFIIFYLFCGIAAAYSHAFADPVSMVPMIGASGAVSGILGAYLLLFPFARVHTLLFFFIFIRVVRLPAIAVIGVSIVVQFLNGMVRKGSPGQGGVAWFAHIGGFVIGLLAIKFFLMTKNRSSKF